MFGIVWSDTRQICADFKMPPNKLNFSFLKLNAIPAAGIFTVCSDRAKRDKDLI